MDSGGIHGTSAAEKRTTFSAILLQPRVGAVTPTKGNVYYLPKCVSECQFMNFISKIAQQLAPSNKIIQ